MTIFFVLSGFLITKILIDKKDQPKPIVLKNFYARRTLRIFPIYYFTIFTLLVLENYSQVPLRSHALYFLTYTENFLFFKTGQWHGNLSHLWSLAVEEQFYLIWPWIILFTKKKYLLHVIIGFILIGGISYYFFVGIKQGLLLPFSCFDAFGLGALLSWQITYRLRYAKKFFTLVSISSIISLLMLAYNIYTLNPSYPLRTESAIVGLWIITYVVHNHDKKLKFQVIFNNKLLIFLGKMSYGLYLYHYLIIIPPITKILNILNWYLPYYKYNTKLQPLVLIPEYSVLLILVSWLSYTLIEIPFLRLKKYFDYKTPNKLSQAFLALHKV